jgi:hypothetical protein
MPAMLIVFARAAVLGLALLAAGCGATGTSRISDELMTTSALAQDKKGVALIKLGAADPSCAVLAAGIGVRDSDTFRLAHTARIVPKTGEATVAELALDPGEYHVVSYVCMRPNGAHLTLSEPMGGDRFKKSYASFAVQSGEVVNVGVLRLVPLGASQGAFSRVLLVGVVATDWPMSELESFKQQRPALYAQMKTRLMLVPKIVPPTVEQVAAKCAEMKKLQAEGKIQNLPIICTAPLGRPPAPKGIAKGEVRA